MFVKIAHCGVGNEHDVWISTEHLSEIKEQAVVMSNGDVYHAAVMSNGNTYYMTKDAYEQLTETLAKIESGRL